MKTAYLLAIDQGTTGTRVIVLDTKLKVVGQAYRELPQSFPKPGWVEHDLEEIWRATVTCIRRALKDAQLPGKRILAIGLTNQRETTGLWMRDTGRPVHPAIVWQDRRTQPDCERLKGAGHEPLVKERTGLVLDPYFSATKLSWLLANVRQARARAERGELCFGTIDTWLVHRLTGGAVHVTDASNASRTLLMNLTTQSWDDELLRLFDVPAAVLPAIRGNAEVYGTTKGVAGLPDGIPIAGMAGDQQAALFGQGCFEEGAAKCTYGTGAFLLMNVGREPVRSGAGLLTSVAWRLGSTVSFALEGSTFIAGAAVQWLRDGLKLIRKSKDVEALAATVKDTGDVVFVPALAGLGAPHWRPEARGLLAGLDRSTTAGHLARAVLEGVAFSVLELAQAMQKDSERVMPVFKVDGGASANDLLMQMQADLLATTVVRPKNTETTSLGAAFLAGLGAGAFESTEALRGALKVDRAFKPKMTAEHRARQLEKWRRAVERA